MKIRERKRSDGEVSFMLDYTINGQRIRQAVPFTSATDAKQSFGKTPRQLAEMAAAEIQKRILRGEQGLQRDPDIALSEILDTYAEHKRASVSPRMAKLIEATARQAVEIIGDRPARTIRPRDWRDYADALKRNGNTPPTINRKVGTVKAAFSLAHKAGDWTGDNPLSHWERLSDTRPEKWRWLRHDEIDRLLSHLRNGSDRRIERRNGRHYTVHIEPPVGMLDLVMILLNTGARRGEALALRWRDVDLDKGLIHITTTKRAAKGRRATIRHIPVNSALRDHLNGIGPEGRDPDAHVIDISPHGLRRKFTAACQDAGIVGHIRLHDLRHTFCSHLAQSGIPLNTIRELAGHTTMTMTLRYSHLAPNTKSEAVDALNFGAQGDRARILAMGE